MTKKEAAEKVAKLMKLASGSNNPHEAETARNQAEKIAKDHDLSSGDLETGKLSAAFDELVDGIQKFVSNHPAMPEGLFNSSAIVHDILNKIKNIGETDKSVRLRQVTTIVRTAAFFTNNQTISGIKAVLDSALKNHGVSI